jgi:hypothetical protein
MTAQTLRELGPCLDCGEEDQWEETATGRMCCACNACPDCGGLLEHCPTCPRLETNDRDDDDQEHDE